MGGQLQQLTPPFSAQVPRIDLPGAEFFALAPNHTIAINQRNSQKFVSTATAIPAGASVNFNIDMPLIPQWGTSQGIYVIRAFSIFVPSDQSGELQITATRMGLGAGLAAIYVDFGFPVLTFSAPASACQMQTESNSLFTFRDMQLVGFPGGPLIFTSSTIVHNNDATNAHSAAIQLQAIYHALTGINE